MECSGRFVKSFAEGFVEHNGRAVLSCLEQAALVKDLLSQP